MNPEVPEVRPVDQKGLGLSSLKQAIMQFSDAPMPIKVDDMDVETKELYNQRRQESLESNVIQIAIDRWRQEQDKLQQVQPSTATHNKGLAPMITQWFRDLVPRIEEELKHIAEAEAHPIRTMQQKERCEYGTYMRCLPPEILASVTILTAMDCVVRSGLEKGIRLAPLVVQIGTDVYDEMMAQRMKEERKTAGSTGHRSKILQTLLAGRKGKDGRMKWRSLVQNMEKNHPEAIWPPAIQAKLGAALMSCLYDVAKISIPAEGSSQQTKDRQQTVVSAFQHSYQMVWGRTSGYIHVQPHVADIVRKEPPSEFLARNLPMICKPKPWVGFRDGAYLLHQNRMVRATPGESLQQTYVKAVLENDGLKPIRESLDILGSTGWVVNKDVFHVMLEAWNSGEPIADLAPLNVNLPIPPKPSQEDGSEARRTWYNKVQEIENQKSGYHSQRCFQNFQLEVARAYLNETFYFPHNLDFRGRAYPIPPYLNQMGSDIARGLLLFSQAKPLGESGLRWLKVQIANLSGFDKASFSEREQFTMDHVDDVYDSANNGLHGRRWWLQAEDPWQCLAACCELRNALQLQNPTEYRSRLPIHQDGSCNGLQHYAALGGDIIGAQQVNLEPSDRPSDVYTGVAEFVKEKVSKEAAEGDRIAKLLDGNISRKVVKQTVMTNVYGVTFVGATKQIRKQIMDLGFSDTDLKASAVYLARKVFEALGSIFNGANEIQFWLGDSASRITSALSPDQLEAIAKDALSPKSDFVEKGKGFEPTKHFSSTVIWTSPLGLPVVQPYRTRTPRRVETSFQSLSVLGENSNFAVSKRKQLQAFPPNFIHSLDATHMLLSAKACHQAGLTFSAVHDSFWTHASDVDSMNEILREAFVLMHSDDVVQRLRSEFNVRYGRHLFWARIRSKSQVGKAISSFRRQHGKQGRIEQILVEYKRQKLLNSEDPELQAQGREMKTAASIFEEFGGTDNDLHVQKSVGEIAVGHIPENVEAAEHKISGLDNDGSDPALTSLLGNSFDNADGVPKPTVPADEELEGAEQAEEVDSAMGDAEPAPKKKRVSQREYIYAWLPLWFRPVPKKGEWDLSRIRDSKYFFS